MSNTQRTLQIQSEAARTLLLNIRDVIGDDDDMAITAIEGETDLVEAISDAVDRIAELEAFEAAISERMKALAERKSRFASQHERIRTALLLAITQADMPRKIELAQATLSVRAVASKVEITDEALIPSQFWKPSDPKLDKKAVLDALKDKQDVPGAVLSNGGETLSIRSK